MKRNSIYLETSALLRWLFQEPGYEKIGAILRSAGLVCTSVLTIMETRRSIQRALSKKALDQAEASQLLRHVEQLIPGWATMEISMQIQNNMARSFAHEPVRTLDAIHLLSAQLFSQVIPGLKVLSMDEKVRRNLRGLGLKAVE